MTRSADPYEPSMLTAESSDSLGAEMLTEPLLEVNRRVSFGRVWPSCRVRLYRDRLELAFLTHTFNLQVERIVRLRSAGKGPRRHLLIEHSDPNVPDIVKTIPHYPGKWYDAFEAVGVATEDQTEFRSANQFLFRSEAWVMNLEAGFWFCVLIVAPVVIGVVKFISDWASS